MVSDSTVREAEREQPQPAEGQVWVPPLDVTPAWWLAQDGTVTVGAPLSDPTLVRLGPYRWLPVTALRRWRCIGVQTEHGRVMVGDEFALPDGGPDVAVRGVLSHDQHVFVDGGRAHGASWLLAWGKRTRYAPARVGERFRDLDDGTVYTIPANQKAAPRLDAAKWERLNPAPSSPLDAPAALGDMQGTDLNPANSADWRRALAMGPRAEQGPSPLPLDASPPASATAAEAPGPAGLAPGAVDGARADTMKDRTLAALRASGHPSTPASLVEAFRGRRPDVRDIAHALAELEAVGLVARGQGGLYRLTTLGKAAAKAGEPASCIIPGETGIGDRWRRDGGYEFEIVSESVDDGERWFKVRYTATGLVDDIQALNLWDCEGYRRTRRAAPDAWGGKGDGPLNVTREPVSAKATRGRGAAPSPVIADGKKEQVDRYRHAIDRAIAADHGPFAPARAAALRALDEHRHVPSLTPAAALDALTRYEEARGGARTAKPEARAAAEQALGEMVVAVYERCRSLPATGKARS